MAGERILKEDKAELQLVYEAPMFIYVQRLNERPFSLNGQLQRLSASELFFKCRAKLKKNEIVGVVFQIAKKDFMANIRISSVRKMLSGLKAEYTGKFVGLNREQEQLVRKYVLHENLRMNKRKRLNL